ncbi:MAG: SRPBCC family protein [Flavipsychrobacter sp.]
MSKKTAMRQKIIFTALSLIILTSTTMAQNVYHVTQTKFITDHNLSAAVSNTVVINKPINEVWELISNWGDAYIYTPGLDKSYCTTDSKNGLASKRHCDIGKGSVEESIVAYEDMSYFILEVYQIDMPMIKKLFAEFEVTDLGEGKTKFTLSMAYKMPLGKIMKGKIKNNVTTNSYAIKHYLETGDAQTSKNAKKIKQLYL